METEATTLHSQPSKVQDSFWIWYCIRAKYLADLILGKWLVFKHYDEIDDVWEKIRTAIARDELQGCVNAKCSTMRYNPTLEGPGPSTTSVICVYTKEHNMDDIGFKLIEIVKQDIKYKTDDDTRKFKYTYAGSGRVTIKTIFWNNGKPSFECEDRPCYGTSFRREDIWHLNVVTAPEPLGSREDHGRWVLYLENEDLTYWWHLLKDFIDDEEKNYGIIRMVCPPKRVRNSPTEKPVFHIYTSGKDRKVVGKRLIELIEDDLDYQHKCRNPNMPGVVENPVLE